MTTQNTNSKVARAEDDPNIDSASTLPKSCIDVDGYQYHGPGNDRVVISVKARYATQMEA
ncbi:MAG: hypothetical protein M3151_03890 [Actinomycetota bacterium]|nr:hypothetical protein [Actinomycetota bacterium]